MCWERIVDDDNLCSLSDILKLLILSSTAFALLVEFNYNITASYISSLVGALVGEGGAM